MAARKQHMGERIIEADNGFGWTRRRGSSALAISTGTYETDVFGVSYKLEKFDHPRDEAGWYLYSPSHPSDIWGEFCATNLLPAIDVASEMIVKADLRGEGYEKKEDSTS